MDIRLVETELRQSIEQSLGMVLAAAGARQWRMAEDIAAPAPITSANGSCLSAASASDQRPPSLAAPKSSPGSER